MIKKCILIAVFIVSALLPTSWAVANDSGMEYVITGSATLGGGGVGVDNRSFKFGEYTGLEDDGGFVEFDADLTIDHGPHYLDFFADNLGIDNRSLYLEAGEWGSYSFFASYSETPHLTSGNSATPFVDPNASNLLLPGAFNRNTRTFNMGTDNGAGNMIANDMRPVELRIDRRTAIFGASKSFGMNEFEVSYERKRKEGLQGLGGGSFFSEAVIVPEAVEQIVHEVKAVFAHNGEDHQYQLQYFFSLFDNDRESLTFETPFSGRCNVGICRISREPDNYYHKVSLTGGWNVSESTRLSAVAEYGLMLQDDNLLPFSTDPLPNAGGTPAVLPRASADARIHTIHLNLRVSSNPLPGLSFGARFRHYQTINELSKTLFRRVRMDSGPQSAIAAHQSQITQPYEYQQDEIILDGSYRVFKGTYIKAKYKFEYMDRNHREVEESVENMFEGRIRSTFIPNTSFTAHASFSRKDGLDDSAFKVFSSRQTPAHVAIELAAGTAFINHPALSQYDVADRDRIKAGANLTFFPMDSVTLGAGYEYVEDDYRNSVFGLNYRMTHNITADVSYAPNEGISFYGYYNYRNNDFTQTSQDADGPAISPADIWRAAHDDDSHTIGAGANLTFLNDRLAFNLDYSYSESESDIRFVMGGTPTAGVPTLMTELHRVEASGEYKALDRLTIGVRYILEDYSDSDFATDGLNTANPIFLDRTLLLSGSEPDYTGHIGILYGTWFFGDRD